MKHILLVLLISNVGCFSLGTQKRVETQSKKSVRQLASVPSGKFMCLKGPEVGTYENFLQTHCDANKNWTITHVGHLHTMVVCCIKR